MEIVKTKYQAICDALKQLDISLKYLHDEKFQEVHDQMRNSTIQCLEFCVEALWKFLKVYLTEVENVAIKKTSSVHALRACLQEDLISAKEFDLLKDIIEDRNLTSHTYNGELAEEISQNIPKHYQVMHTIVERFSEILKR